MILYYYDCDYDYSLSFPRSCSQRHSQRLSQQRHRAAPRNCGAHHLDTPEACAACDAEGYAHAFWKGFAEGLANGLENIDLVYVYKRPTRVFVYL